MELASVNRSIDSLGFVKYDVKKYYLLSSDTATIYEIATDYHISTLNNPNIDIIHAVQFIQKNVIYKILSPSASLSFSPITTVRVKYFHKTSIPKYEQIPSPTAPANMTIAPLRKITLVVYCFSP